MTFDDVGKTCEKKCKHKTYIYTSLEQSMWLSFHGNVWLSPIRTGCGYVSMDCVALL